MIAKASSTWQLKEVERKPSFLKQANKVDESHTLNVETGDLT